jgi:hypothetical protein
LGRH